MSNLQFDAEPFKTHNAVVVSFDLCGFSEFCRQPDAHVIVSRFVARLFGEINQFFKGGFEEISDQIAQMVGLATSTGRIRTPDFMKFTGDGAIMMWLKEEGCRFDDSFCTTLIAVMRTLQAQIAAVVPEWERDWQVHGLPRRARFGIAKGVVFGLLATSDIPFSGPVDYVGYCINLAVRLQNHCPELGFLVHGPLHPQIEGLRQLTAKNLKGAQNEPVLVFETDWEQVSGATLKRKFIDGQ